MSAAKVTQLHADVEIDGIIYRVPHAVARALQLARQPPPPPPVRLVHDYGPPSTERDNRIGIASFLVGGLLGACATVLILGWLL